jgi:hypothetical protein
LGRGRARRITYGPSSERAFFTAKHLRDLLVGLLPEQPDDDGAKVLVARPSQPLQVVDHALVEPDEISALRGLLALIEDVAAQQHGEYGVERLRGDGDADQFE